MLKVASSAVASETGIAGMRVPAEPLRRDRQNVSDTQTLCAKLGTMIGGWWVDERHPRQSTARYLIRCEVIKQRCFLGSHPKVACPDDINDNFMLNCLLLTLMPPVLVLHPCHAH
ncbi:hypothetical protein OPQ81_001771 [Rhizoctonia solani]|nr:hypothetical protein OPQ81_001771 [Rhizoctonia solani]